MLVTYRVLLLSILYYGTYRVDVIQLRSSSNFRALEFIREFLFEFMMGTPDMSTCAGNAYGKTLRKYHGMVVRGVFAASALIALRVKFNCSFLGYKVLK